MKKSKPTILLLTNFNHKIEGDIDLQEEDILLADQLRKRFRVIMCHPKDSEVVEDKVDIVLIRNIWPVFQYEKDWEKIKKRFLRKKLKVYPPLEAKGDMLGKNHMIELFNSGYPVIPTIDNKKDTGKLPRTESYFVKPKNKCDAIGAERLSAFRLNKKSLNGYVIQPYINFKYKVSFYVIDGKIICSFSTPKKVSHYKIKRYNPTKTDKIFVKKFVKWNSLPYGLQRIDACRTQDGKLLLMELEDFNPYLQLLEWDKSTRTKMLNTMVKSINNAISCQ